MKYLRVCKECDEKWIVRQWKHKRKCPCCDSDRVYSIVRQEEAEKEDNEREEG